MRTGTAQCVHYTLRAEYSTYIIKYVHHKVRAIYNRYTIKCGDADDEIELHGLHAVNHKHDQSILSRYIEGETEKIEIVLKLEKSAR